MALYGHLPSKFVCLFVISVFFSFQREYSILNPWNASVILINVDFHENASFSCNWLMYNLWKIHLKIFDFKKSLYFFYDAIAEFDKRKRIWIGNLKMQRMQTFVLFFLSIKIIFCRIWGWISQLSYGTYLFRTAGCDRNPC